VASRYDDRGAAAGLVGGAGLGPDRLEPFDPLVPQHPIGRHPGQQLDPFALGGVHFLRVGRHLIAAPPVDDPHGRCIQAHHRPGHVQRGISPAHDEDPLAPRVNRLSSVERAKHVECQEISRKVVSAHSERQPGHRTEPEIHGAETLVEEAGERHVPTEPDAALELDPVGENPVRLVGQHVPRQTVFGDSLDKNSAGLGRLVQNLDRVPT